MRSVEEIRLKLDRGFKGEVFGVAGAGNSQWMLVEYLPYEEVPQSFIDVLLNANNGDEAAIRKGWDKRYKKRSKQLETTRVLNREIAKVLYEASLAINSERIIIAQNLLIKAMVYSFLIGFDTTEAEDKMLEYKEFLASNPEYDESSGYKDMIYEEQLEVLNEFRLEQEKLLLECFMLIKGGERFVHEGETRPRW